MCEAVPVLPVRVVLLGEVGLQRPELLAAETRPDSLRPAVAPPTRLPVIQSGLRTADRLLPVS